MDNKVEILGQAIRRAIEGGWAADGLGGPEDWYEHSELERQHFLKIFFREGSGDGYMLIIFNHDFAKALWGEGLMYTDGDFVQCPVWQHHLQQMVIADDPIAYLAEHMPKDGQ